ncbi:MAG: hypothetical protein C0603_09495 [Denitrovibrio sp.]|nr:MAG: hypothetical protein C0603_09495 [Denitrovibrio sp.]
MDCTKFHELISLYVDEEASSVQGQALEKHLESCTGCKAYLANQIKLKNMINESYNKVVDIDLSAKIMNNISAPKLVSKPSKVKKLSVYVAAVAAACVITIAALMSLHVDNNTVAGNQKLEEYIIEHVGTGNGDFNGQVEAVNIEK